MNRAEATKETRKQARAWMVLNNIRAVDIQRALAMKNHNLVSATMSGTRNNRRVLEYLVRSGCPVKYLALPKDRQSKEKTVNTDQGDGENGNGDSQG